MPYGDTFSAVQDASLREKAMRDQNLNAAFSRMMAAKQLDQNYALAQQQLGLEHEKLKMSTVAAAMAHDQQMRHNDILEKQVDGYLDLQKRAVDRQHEADDHVGQTIANNIHELSGETEKSLSTYEAAKAEYAKYANNMENMYRGSGILVKNPKTGLFEPADPKNAEYQNTAEFINSQLQNHANAVEQARKKYEFDATNHGHAVNFATQKGFMIDHKTGEVIDMTRGKKFVPIIPQSDDNSVGTGDAATTGTEQPVNGGFQVPASDTSTTNESGGDSSSTGNQGFALPIDGQSPTNSPTSGEVILRDKSTGRKFSYAGDPQEVPTNIFEIVQ